jgi:hypothetical protein
VLRARNGSEVKACRKANCEILIRGAVSIPLDPRFGCNRFTVTYAAPNQVRIMVERSRLNDVRVIIKGTGYVGLANEVTVTVKKIDASGAVLGFSPTTADTGNDNARGTDGLSMF